VAFPVWLFQIQMPALPGPPPKANFRPSGDQRGRLPKLTINVEVGSAGSVGDEPPQPPQDDMDSSTNPAMHAVK
jgi:hypothetical protein